MTCHRVQCKGCGFHLKYQGKKVKESIICSECPKRLLNLMIVQGQNNNLGVIVDQLNLVEFLSIRFNYFIVLILDTF